MDQSFEWNRYSPLARRRWLSAPALWLAVFALLILSSRIAGLQTEIVNWDENTFMLMGQDVLRGHLPYVHGFDNKPPGIFLWTAGVVGLFGPNIAAVRLAGALWVFGAAAAAFAIARRFAPVPQAGIAVALLLTATFDPIAGGFNSTEWPCAALLLAALWLQIARGRRLEAAFAAGLCAALAVLFRSNAVVVAAMLGLVYAAGWRFEGLKLHRAGALAFAAGLALPPLALAALYLINSEFHALWLANVTVPYSYSRDQNGFVIAARDFFTETAGMALRQPYTLGPGLALAGIGVWAAWRRRGRIGRDLVKLVAATAAGVLSILVCGTYYPHYLVQSLLFVAPFAAMALDLDRRGLAAAIAAAAVAVLLVSEIALGGSVLVQLGTITANYDARRTADALRPQLGPKDEVWALKNHLILVYLDRPPISPAAMHPSNLVRPSIIRPLIAAGYVPPDAFGHVVASLPAFVVTDAHRPVPYYVAGDDAECLALMLVSRYVPWKRFGDIAVYRRNSDAAPITCPPDQ